MKGSPEKDPGLFRKDVNQSQVISCRRRASRAPSGGLFARLSVLFLSLFISPWQFLSLF